MDSYEINTDTLALIPINSNKTKVLEKDKELYINLSTMKIIKNSCEYFGSSYLGRFSGTKKLIGVSHKAPIIIEETNNIIFFPTTSPRLNECVWINLKNIINYKKFNGKTLILFENNIKLELNISYGSFDNQVLRSYKLDSILRKRKETIKI